MSSRLRREYPREGSERFKNGVNKERKPRRWIRACNGSKNHQVPKRILLGKSRFSTDRQEIMEDAQEHRPRNLPIKTVLRGEMFFDGSGKCLLAHLIGPSNFDQSSPSCYYDS